MCIMNLPSLSICSAEIILTGQKRKIRRLSSSFTIWYRMDRPPIDEIADKYEQMNPKANDGKYGCWFMWGLGTDYEKAGMLGADKIHMVMVPSLHRGTEAGMSSQIPGTMY